MAVDFIDLIRQVSGTSPLETINEYVGDPLNANNPITIEEGIFQRIKDKEANIANINTSADAIKLTLWGTDSENGSAGTVLNDINVKYDDTLIKYSDLVLKYTDFAGSDGLGGKYKIFTDNYNSIDITAMSKVAAIDVEIAGVAAISAAVVGTNANATNIDAVKANELNITKTASMETNINTTASMESEIAAAVTNEININKVAVDIASVVNTGSSIIEIVALNNNMNVVEPVGEDLNLGASSKVLAAYTETLDGGKIDIVVQDLTAAYSNIANAKQNADDAQSAVDGINADANRSEESMWDAEAIRRTADSYATEPEDVPVKIWVSNGDGTYTQNDAIPTEYSAYHWKQKASGASGDVDTSTMTFTNKTMTDISNKVAANTVDVKVIAQGVISKGDVVKVVGWNTAYQCAIVEKIVDINESAVGICPLYIADGGYGFIRSKGYISNIDTTALTVGTLVYSDGTGGITDAASSTNFQTIGYCLNVDVSAGAIYVECTAIEYDQGLVDQINTKESIVNVAAGLATKEDKFSYATKTANYNLADRDYIFVDSSAGVFTLVLPASPAVGATITVLDIGGSLSVNNVTIDRNLNTIMGLADDMLLNLDLSESKFIFTGSDWRMTSIV